MQILRAFQIIKQDGMYKANIIYNTVENGIITKANQRKTIYLTDETTVKNASSLDEFFTQMISEK